MKQFERYLDIKPEVKQALEEGKPVIALESTIISHGMPYPRNVETALAVEEVIRKGGAVPATIGIIQGRIKIGLTSDEIEYMASAPNVLKVSRRDFPLVIVEKMERLDRVLEEESLRFPMSLSYGVVYVDGGERLSAAEVMKLADERMYMLKDMKKAARNSVGGVVMTWVGSKDLETGNEEIDREHRQLLSAVNRLLEACAAGRGQEELNRIVDFLVQYTQTHFAHEEAYMESIHDPELSLQKTQHAMFTQKVNSFVPDTSSPEAARKSLNDLLTYLVRWLYRHILCSDMMIGKSLSSTESDPFAFTSKYMTGITLIDDEHRRLFEIIKETNDLIHEEFLHDKYDEIVRLITELRDYTEFHFSDEEALMTRIQYPGLDAQKRAHSAFIERLVEIDLNDLDEHHLSE